MATICCTTKQPPRALGGNIPTTRAAPDTQNTVRGGEATRLSPTLSPNLARYTKEKPRSARVLGRACDVLEHFASDHAARGYNEVRLTQHRASQGKIAAMCGGGLYLKAKRRRRHISPATLSRYPRISRTYTAAGRAVKNKEEEAWSRAFERTSATPRTAVERGARGGRRRGE